MACNSDVVNEHCEVLTKFMLRTYRTQPTEHDVGAVVWSSMMAAFQPYHEPEADKITLISGSSAELYIKPMLSYIGDIDIMQHFGTRLAIPAGYPPPIHLPTEFNSRVAVCEIIPSKYPGYVYLKPRYLLTENQESGAYKTMDDCKHGYLSARPERPHEIHGPASTLRDQRMSLMVDDVHSVRCLFWPTQADDWPMRYRNYGWPDSATVDRVVRNGCDVVRVAHSLCKQDELEGTIQWRLSFSRAEIVLLNSWMPVEQIAYHMLRVFVKTERLTDITDNSGSTVLSNYHIKTLILWACELRPRSWWIEATNVVRICLELFHTLAFWLNDQRCSHYFISNSNLLCNAVNAKIIGEQLISVTESWLSRWFINNYILKCAQLCPSNVSRLFDDISSNVQLDEAVSAVVDWRRSTAISELYDVFIFAELNITTHVSMLSVTVHSCHSWMTSFGKIALKCSDYFTGIAFLHFLLKASQNDFAIEALDVLSTICTHFRGRKRNSSERSSALLVNQASMLMKLVMNNSRSTVQLIEVELSKAYLYRALRCKDSDKYCLANVYLAVLYFTTGQYQSAIDHCILVTRSHDHSKCSSHVVQGELLPKIADDVDDILGLAAFYQYVRTTALNQQPRQHVSVFTTELFAHYMHITCLLFIERHHFIRSLSTNDLQSYKKQISDGEDLFIGDLLLFKMTDSTPKRHYHYKSRTYQRVEPTPSTTELNSAELVRLLEKSAVEHLTRYRQFQEREFGYVAAIMTKDFEAMYAYKHGDYQLCLQMCTQSLHDLLKTDKLHQIFMFPEILQFLDNDIVSLIALTLTINPTCRFDSSSSSDITQLTLSLYLMTQCQLKLCHSSSHLDPTLNYIKFIRSRTPADWTLDRLILKLTERKAILNLHM